MKPADLRALFERWGVVELRAGPARLTVDDFLFLVEIEAGEPFEVTGTFFPDAGSHNIHKVKGHNDLEHIED